MRLLMVEDDRDLCDAVEVYLNKEGYEVDICNNGDEVDYYLEKTVHDAIILDRMLPGVDGLTILKNIREKGIATPVIMVTALGTMEDKIDGLDCGADDYVVKPYDVEELSARIRAVLRRPRQIENQDKMSYADLEYEKNTMMARCGQLEVKLTKKEANLLEYFMINKEQVLTREQILSRVWGKDNFALEGNIDNYIFFVRRRLKTIKTKVCISTVHGVGYRLECM